MLIYIFCCCWRVNKGRRKAEFGWVSCWCYFCAGICVPRNLEAGSQCDLWFFRSCPTCFRASLSETWAPWLDWADWWVSSREPPVSPSFCCWNYRCLSLVPAFLGGYWGLNSVLLLLQQELYWLSPFLLFFSEYDLTITCPDSIQIAFLLFKLLFFISWRYFWLTCKWPSCQIM